MPTSYTTNFRLALPATGELSGTWGNTVNTAITSLVDSMESQSTISVTTASQALTANNGVVDQARSLYLSFSQLGVNATYTVYAPPVQKMYVVYNSDPTYNLVFAVSNAVNSTTPSGGSTATIAPLQRVTLYNDGVNITPLFNTVLGSLTFGAIAGTTGTFSGAVSGASLAGGAATGIGASGTWPINVTGSAGSAASATNATNATNVTGGTVAASSMTLGGSTIQSGTYSPTYTPIANISSISTAYSSSYLKVGKTCTVSGSAVFVVTASGTLSGISITLPFAAGGTTLSYGSGAISAPGSTLAYLFITPGNANLLQLNMSFSSFGSLSAYWTFTYQTAA